MIKLHPLATQGGTKLDARKNRYDLISADALDELARVYSIGAAKYTDRQWEQGIQFGRVFAAMMRHSWKWMRGEELDQEDGQRHLASVAWCALALLHYSLNPVKYGKFDDRPKEG
jgi:hypothetical protein